MVGTLVVCSTYRFEDFQSLLVGNCRLTTKLLRNACQRCLAAEVDSLGVDRVAEVALQRCASLRCRSPDRVEVIGGHVTDEYVRHALRLSIALSHLQAWRHHP